jgi:glycosyltransferase involved in cell wall biosynthesis
METGLIIPPSSTEDLVNALMSLKDNKLRQKLGQNARLFAENNLGWPNICEQLVGLFNSVLHNDKNRNNR